VINLQNFHQERKLHKKDVHQRSDHHEQGWQSHPPWIHSHQRGRLRFSDPVHIVIFSPLLLFYIFRHFICADFLPYSQASRAFSIVCLLLLKYVFNYCWS
jgi:hypothetical protein